MPIPGSIPGIQKIEISLDDICGDLIESCHHLWEHVKIDKGLLKVLQALQHVIDLLEDYDPDETQSNKIDKP